MTVSPAPMVSATSTVTGGTETVTEPARTLRPSPPRVVTTTGTDSRAWAPKKSTSSSLSLSSVTCGKHVIFLEQENRNNLGGQAFWSLGGLFYVDSPEQKMMRVKDSEELAWRDWANSADYDPVTDNDRHDYWGHKWGREYVRFAANEKRSYLKGLGLNVLPTIGWAERGSGDASGHGNSVPRFHLTWGTGPEVVRVFRKPLLKAEEKGQVEFLSLIHI